MKVALGFIIGLSAVALGCASVQETRMFKGPFGRTQIASTILAADPGSGKILVQTSDGMLRVFRMSAVAGRTLGGYRVGDGLLLTFDDRTSGDAVVAIEGLQVSASNMPFGRLPQFALPSQVRVGAALFGTGTTFGSVTDVAGDRVVQVNGVAPSSAFGARMGGGGVVVPGFSSIASIQPGALTAQQTANLGLAPSNGAVPGAGPVTAGNFTPGTVMPGVTTLNPATGGKPSIQGPFTPGTVSPGVRTSADGKPVNQGPFTPGTIAPGVSATLGNAPPTTAGSTTGSSGSSQGLSIRTPGAAPPAPDSSTTTNTGVPSLPGGISVPGTGTGAPLPETGATTGTTGTATPQRDARTTGHGTTPNNGTPAPGATGRPAGMGQPATAPTGGQPAGGPGAVAPPSGPVGNHR